VGAPIWSGAPSSGGKVEEKFLDRRKVGIVMADRTIVVMSHSNQTRELDEKMSGIYKHFEFGKFVDGLFEDLPKNAVSDVGRLAVYNFIRSALGFSKTEEGSYDMYLANVKDAYEVYELTCKHLDAKTMYLDFVRFERKIADFKEQCNNNFKSKKVGF